MKPLRIDPYPTIPEQMIGIEIKVRGWSRECHKPSTKYARRMKTALLIAQANQWLANVRAGGVL